MLALRDQHRAKRREEIEEERKKKEEEERIKREQEKNNGDKTTSGFNKVLASLSEAQAPAPTKTMPESGSTLYKVGTGFKPFASNPAKQARYEAYLEAKKSGETCK